MSWYRTFFYGVGAISYLLGGIASLIYAAQSNDILEQHVWTIMIFVCFATEAYLCAVFAIEERREIGNK
jgi:predicted membrane channel-forming protein YqfA (hemolysin III family)